MPPESLTLTVVRPDDLLVLILQFDGVLVTQPQAGQPGEIAGAGNSRLTVWLQPQHIAEQAFLQVAEDHQFPVPSDEEPLPPGSVLSRLAGPSRLVFTVPAGETIPLTLAGLLDALQRLPLSVSAVNRWQPPGCLALFRWLARPPAVAPPAATDTAIEAPWRLILSPDDLARWRHALVPVVRGDWTELWHTRLGTSRGDGDPRVRAIWSPDFQAGAVDSPFPDQFRTSLTGGDRNEIVHLTSNYRIPGYLPKPVETERLTLSALGAWLKVTGNWEPPQLNQDAELSVEHWRHEATMGRDQFVRVVRRGFLCPLGHRAVKVTVSERKFLHREDAQTPGSVAYLYQREFIIVRQFTRSYGDRDMPLRSVTFKTRETPNLHVPSGQVPGSAAGKAFWARIDVGGGPFDFQFNLQGTDWEGRPVEWNMPLIWVDANEDQNNVDPVLQEYNVTHDPEHARRKRPLSGQTLAFAPSSKPGDTAFEAADLSFEARPVTGGDGPHFRPAMKQANVDLPAVKQLLGKDAPSKIEWEPTYLGGSGNKIGNKGDVFAKLIGTTPLEFATEKVGGMVAPDIGISGLSRSLGPVGGPVSQMVAGSFKPKDVFPSVKLLGGLDLWEIVKDMIFDAAGTTGGKLPGLTTERAGNVIRTKYVWKIGSAEMVQDHTLFKPTPASEFTLEAVVETPLDGTPPAFHVDGSLTRFSVVLLPAAKLVGLTFSSVSFHSVPGEKPDVAVELGGIEFMGILEFVRRLQEYIPLDGFKDPPNLEIVQSPHPGVNVGFTLGIPDIAIGIATIQNVSLGAGFFLPFGDAPLNFHFAFCERQQPFILTVSLFGGGGFFGIDIGIDGVKMIEAALEFGASVALNLGVASGEASIMAGFYFQMAGKDFQLTGYFRAAGSLSVLGIITVSLEFYLGLTYASKGISPHGGTLWGQASLKVKIEILFFSMSVSVSMEREFAGSDPKFRQMLAPADWEEYADAFAAYP